MKTRSAYTVVLAAVLVFSAAHARADGYLDLTLDRAVSVALEKNREIIKAREEVKRAYPQINGQWTMDRNLKPQVFVIQFPDENGVMRKNRLKVGTDHMMNLGANLTQPIWIGGKVGTALEAAKIYRNMSDETFKAVEQNIVTGVMTAFNGILLARELVGISRESLELAELHLKNVRTLHEAGAATDYDLLRAKVHVENTRPDLVEAENNVNIALLRLRDILGIDPDIPLTISGALTEPDTTVFRLAESETAFRNRPDFKAAEFNIELQEKAVRIAYGDFLPSLTAGTTFAYTGNFDLFRYDAADWNPYWMANVSLTFPIFSGFRNTAVYEQAKVDRRKAQTDFHKTRNTIVIEVEEGVMNLRKAVRQVESQRMNVEEARKAVDMAESLFRNGRATQLEVLDAQLALEISKTNLANALYAGKTAEINLKKALGILDSDRNGRD